ncbi:unnamed protein product [Rhizophagus irregularis]|nr:unnamed protein product [Rhizophagus irregularis]
MIINVRFIVLESYFGKFAEGKIPYEDSNDIVDITDKRLKPFVMTQLLGQKLQKCLKKPPTPKRAFSIDQDAYALPINLPDFESFKYMTLADAAKQHKIYKNGKPSGDVKTAYKCFEAYTNNPNTTKRNRITAKYYKAVYISRGFVESPPNKDKIVAELFKEVADDEENEYLKQEWCCSSNVQRWKICIIMVLDVKKDIEKAKNYIELAVYNGYEAAIKFRNEYKF